VLIAPRASFRRAGGRFFGKILKVDATVTPVCLPILPRPAGLLPPRPRIRPGGLPAAALVVAAALLGAAAASGQSPVPAASVYRKGQPAAAADDAQQAERVVAAALAGLGRADSISARLRQRVRVGDRVLVGAGRYVQSGQGEDQRYRYEAALECDTESFEVLDVCDGLFAWSFRRIGPQPAQIERFDVRRVRERLRSLGVADDAAISPWLGGPQRTLSLMRDWFRFVSIEPGMIEDMPVWVVDGRWVPEHLASILPDRAEAARRPEGVAPAELPDGMPWCVRLWIGQRELFPFRLEWLAIPGRRPVAPAEPEPIAVTEFYELRIGGPVDATAFVYKPAAEDGLLDLTDGHVKAVAPLRP
jgi:hypothetical protein